MVDSGQGTFTYFTWKIEFLYMLNIAIVMYFMIIEVWCDNSDFN